MSKSVILFFALLYGIYSLANGQTISVKANNQPLNHVLVELRDNYDLQLSFNHHKLSAYKVTINQTFDSPNEAIAFILKDVPLEYKYVSGTYLIVSVKLKLLKKEFTISGVVRDIFDKEGLPYAHVMVNNVGIITDLAGNFKFISKKDSTFKLKISYLGYYLLDTLVRDGMNRVFNLYPSMVGIQEINIKGKSVDKSAQIGDLPGVITVNQKVASFLPGNGDNAVYNLIRLQPGVLASGESSNDFVIWGSYDSHSQVIYDGFTVFGLKNFNDNISVVNPFMAKNIKIHKGAYGATLGGRVGGIVEITGKQGNFDKPTAEVNIDNYTLNAKASVPLGKTNNLAVAVRKTYYNLYNGELIRLPTLRQQNEMFQYEATEPDYLFNDLNLRFTGKRKNGDYYFVSLLGASDHFSYLIEQQTQNLRNNINIEREEGNQQYGMSALYNKVWANGNTSKFTQTYSGLSAFTNSETTIIHKVNNQQQVRNLVFTSNRISELKTKVSNTTILSENNSLNWGMAFLTHGVFFEEDSLTMPTNSPENYSSRIGGFAQNSFSFSNSLKIDLGLRIDYPLNLKKTYLQPRFKISYRPAKYLKTYFALGKYNQFNVKASAVDAYGNYRYFWTTSDHENIPVLHSQHYVSGISYNRNKTTLSIEAFRKTTNGIIRYVNLERMELGEIFEGDSKTNGLDLFARQEYRGHTVWAAYTLSSTLENFAFFRDHEYRRAPQDQRHEFKAAGVVNLRPFYLSANYVYGSGFPDPTPNQNDSILANIPYHRFDVSVQYHLPVKYHAVIGFSILNVLNHQNIKALNFERIPLQQTSTLNVYSEAVPFTPSMYLNIRF